MIWFLIWVACGLFAASIASSKGYSGCLWAIIGFLLGPLALLGIGFMEKKAPDETQDYEGPAMRPCPYCVEPIRWKAIKCKHCGSEVTPPR
jgi:hypothetical protein